MLLTEVYWDVFLLAAAAYLLPPFAGFLFLFGISTTKNFY